MSLYFNSGVPEPHTVDLADKTLVSFRGETMAVYVSAPQGTKIYFSNADLDAGQNYITIPASGTWQAMARVEGLLLSGSGAAEVVGFLPGR